MDIFSFPETQEQKDADRKRRRKKKKKKSTSDVTDDTGEGDHEAEEEETDFGDEFLSDEDLDDESSTLSSSISIDPDLEVISSSQILKEDEMWEEIEIEEESLDDEQRKVYRKVKKRVKKKIPKKEEEKELELRPSELAAMEAKAGEGKLSYVEGDIESVEGFKGKHKDEVRASGLFNLIPGEAEVASLVSEPDRIQYSFVHIPGIGPIVPERQIKAVIKFMTECSVKQSGYVMPRNIRHFLCPPLDLECKNDYAIRSASSAASSTK